MAAQLAARLVLELVLMTVLFASPVLTAIVYPLAGPATAVVVVMALLGFDRFTATRVFAPWVHLIRWGTLAHQPAALAVPGMH